jgi:hypothetical protein
MQTYWYNPDTKETTWFHPVTKQSSVRMSIAPLLFRALLFSGSCESNRLKQTL